jgi:hypothetical protein
MERNWEIPTLCGERWEAAACREDRKIGGGDARCWEVGASHSIAEVVERPGHLRGKSVGWLDGDRGEKGLRQEELGRAKHVPDTEPET